MYKANKGVVVLLVHYNDHTILRKSVKKSLFLLLFRKMLILPILPNFAKFCQAYYLGKMRGYLHFSLWIPIAPYKYPLSLHGCKLA